MIETLKTKLKKFTNDKDKYNYLREYLQLLILQILDEKGCFRNIAFLGGTALRILYDLKRFSEDLDFSLINTENYSFANIMKSIERELRLKNFDVTIRYKDHKTVASAFIKFNNILHQTNLTSLKDQKLLVKFEVDQKPPEGFKTEFTMINNEFLIGITHFDLPSLFAGKIHALLCRKYAKGRDYYDLTWYLTKNIAPNYTLLNKSMEQTEQHKFNLTKKTLHVNLIKLIEQTDFAHIKKDIEPFLENPKEIRFFEKDVFLTLLENKMRSDPES